MSFTTQPVLIGTNARLFASNWRPALEEVAFAGESGFAAMQFHGQPDGLGAEQLGAPVAAIGTALRDAGIAPVMEILMFLDGAGRHESGRMPLEIFQANLPAIAALGCVHVHWHMAIRQAVPQANVDSLELSLVAQLREAVALAADYGFRLAFEHNEVAVRPLNTPERAAALLAAVPGLGLVWDLNHASPEQVEGYAALASRITMLHVADTPLPEINHHLPLGMGTIDFPRYLRPLLAAGFAGPAILEIGGLPKSGGYGRDTDAALVDSQLRLAAALLLAGDTKAEL